MTSITGKNHKECRNIVFVIKISIMKSKFKTFVTNQNIHVNNNHIQELNEKWRKILPSAMFFNSYHQIHSFVDTFPGNI